MRLLYLGRPESIAQVPHTVQAGLPESPVDDGIHQHLDGVAVCQKVDDVKSMPDYSHLQIYSVSTPLTLYCIEQTTFQRP